MNLEELRNSLIETIPCIDKYCDKNGTSLQGDLNNEPEPMQCQFCYEDRFPAVDKLLTLITKEIKQARIDEVKNIRKRFHQKRFGISEFMNDRINELNKE